MNKLLLALLCLFFTGNFLYAKPSGITVDNVRDLSFKECLDLNYSRLDVYKKHNLNDRSYLLVWYAIDNDSTKKSRALKQYINAETKDHHLAQMPLKDSDNNMVFALCMDFYKSRKLKDYITRNIFN